MLEKIKKFFYNLFSCENAPEYRSFDVQETFDRTQARFPNTMQRLYDNAPGVDEEASHPLK